MSSKQPTEQKPCFFLKIAGELRNRIYREVLLQPAPIDYGDKGYIRPALLNTCKAIRSEALKIYYYENSFHTDVWAYNASGMYRFRTSLEPIGVNYEKIEEMTTTCFDLASWSNLMEWLRQYHADLNDWRITYKEEEDEDYDRARLQEALSQMFDVVEGLGGMEWEQVEQEMGSLDMLESQFIGLILNKTPSLSLIEALDSVQSGAFAPTS
ncbi:hypothetical protein CLAFUW4_13990 [Fulvia fulva]|uniref:Uncharacterized protein n=1 Tax=Passalora fulva TaxID=5499 RepID=A0A9Q8PLC0_PASFU|nr:uncharacterized protein CLAFUR5_13828 [Fulvia fulva]KAK4610749.1 hypothetical protein CLAFUR4_13993 [Fulvia fulva]KAK4610871.1 hypothetical protein CLAFUR0_13997 [Fulvia fulva]UJO24499.1 hypothetical protein CLAFUR5_13828 [Fulvia fulva]WPV22195.1 hypothetical protein CLAFUW4_13990 [Fulvia fulva]WPV37031.1 hypothetical protein CLAFUW7_13998 [Fulvia fulva]